MVVVRVDVNLKGGASHLEWQERMYETLALKPTGYCHGDTIDSRKLAGVNRPVVSQFLCRDQAAVLYIGPGRTGGWEVFTRAFVTRWLACAQGHARLQTCEVLAIAKSLTGDR